MFTETVLFMTINKKSLRVAITSRPDQGGIMYTKDFDPHHWEYGYDSFCLYEGCFKKDEIDELMELYRNGNKRKVYNIIKKKLKDPDIQKTKIGPVTFGEISERISDEWVDGCKTVMDLLECGKIVGFFEQNIEEFGIDFL